MNFSCDPITPYELITLIVAIGAFLVGVGTIYIAKTTNETNKRIAKRQNVVDLHNAWDEVTEINRKELNGPDVRRAVNALDLTASLWNHDVMEKTLLFQSYWNSFKNLYDTIISIDDLVPGYMHTCKSAISPPIKKAYKGMLEMELSEVKQTKL